MSRLPTRQPDSPVIAVLHLAGGSVRALVGRAGDRPQVLAHERFGPQEAARIDEWLGERGAEAVLVVLPAAAVICRTSTLPAAPDDQLRRAIALQAEAQLPGAAPAHRMACAVLESAPGETSRTGIILAWPEAARVELPPTRRDVDFVPDVAGLAGLLDGARPDAPVVWVDGAEGSVALGLSHANGLVLRATRAEHDSVESWRESLRRIVAETALNAGHGGAFTESMVEGLSRQVGALQAGSAALLAPPEVIEAARRRIQVDGADASWWRDYGIAAGALAARCGGLRDLARMRWAAPAQAPSILQQVATRLSSPGPALRVVVVCLIVALLAPLAASALRLGIIRLKYGGAEEHLKRLQEAKVELAVYEALADASWPMTKLLSDIACNTPRSLDIDQIRLRYGEPVQLSGRAKSHESLSAQEVVALMQQNLLDSGIFSQIRITWGKPDAIKGYEFTLTAEVEQPFFRNDPYPAELDYGTRSLAERLYPRPAAPVAREEPTEAPPPADTLSGESTRLAGNGAAQPQQPQVAAGESGDLPDETRVSLREGGLVPLRTETKGGIGPDAPIPDEQRATGSVPPSQDIPPPLSAEQIAAMTREELLAALARIGAARQRASLRNDPDTKERLQREFRLVVDRLRSMQQPPAGGAP